MSDRITTILVVDDDPDISMMLRLMLEYKGYTVKTADRQEDIYRVLDSHSIDLIIMDMLLSGVNGTDICQSLKQNKEYGRVPLMMISAHPNAKDICQEAGADDFISKPFDMQDILSKIELHTSKN
jgi:two-component system alkaline phosphatase synthesis response regulator PhoP